MQCVQAVRGWRVAPSAPVCRRAAQPAGAAPWAARAQTTKAASLMRLRVVGDVTSARRAYAGSDMCFASASQEPPSVGRGLRVRVRALGEESTAAGPSKGSREERTGSWMKTAGQVALVALVATFSGVAGARAMPLHSKAATATVATSGAVDTGMELADATATADAPAATDAEAPVKKKKKKKKVAPPAEDGTVVEAAAAAPPTPIAAAPEEDPAAVDAAEAAKKAAKDAPTKDGLSYTQMWEMVAAGKVKRVEYCRDRMAVMVTLKEAFEGKLQHRVMMPFDPDLYKYFTSHNVEVDVLPQSVWDMVSAGMARTLTPIIVCVCLFVLVTRSIGGPSDDLSTPLAKKVNVAEVTTTMSDVAGIDHVQEEIEELIDYLRDADRYMDMGARLPAGVLMVGPPGTGKTLLAKAIAGEAQVPFFSAAGSEFTEMFVGVGASRVRNLFSNARKVAPCIIFIDEFDAIGASRTLAMSGMGGMGNEEQTNTINQMLTEMDGFEDNKGVVVLAATNRPAVLDEALTRPGRFDRVLHLPFPGVEGRAQILQVHARDKQIVGEVDWHMIARGCAGWTGADIMSLMNEAAMLAIREGQEQVEERHIVESLEKLKRDAITQGGNKVEKTGGGDESDIQALDPMVRRSICVIEAGRALLGYLMPYYDDLQRVTVFPNGRVSGHTLFVPQESQLESGVMTRGYLESQMVIAMAGRCAERLLLGEDYVTGSSAGYMKDASLIARQMVMRYGYSEKIGPVSLMSGGQQVYLHTDRAEVAYAPMAPETSELVLNETLDILKSAEAKAMYGLSKNIEILKELERMLMDRRSISGADVKALCDKMGAQPFWDTSIGGFTFTQDGKLVVPPTPEDLVKVGNANPKLTFEGLPGDGAPPSENN